MPCISCLNLQWYHILIILTANSIVTQLQKLWIFHYIPTHYSSVPFRWPHYYTPGLIILTRKQVVVVLNVFFLLQQWFSTVSLNVAKSRPTILSEPGKKFSQTSIDTFSFFALMNTLTQNIRGVTERHCL